MEYEYSTSANPETPQQLVVDDAIKAYLLETARWGKFLGIMGIIGTVFIIIAALFMFAMGGAALAANAYGPAMGAFGGLFGFVYLLIAALTLYYAIQMLKFSSHTKASLQTNNQHELVVAFRHLKNKYKFMGIVTIIMLILYGLIIIFGIVIAVTTGLS